MDTRDLRYFEVICDTGSLSVASSKLFRTQPALSKSIKRLELEFGTPLFTRDGGRLKLTDVGEILLLRARMLNAAMAQTHSELQQWSQGVEGNIRVGHTASAMADLIPLLLARLRKIAPGISVELSIGLNDELRAALRAGRIDVVLGPLLNDDNDFACHPVLDDAVVISAWATHPLLRKPGSMSLADLCRYEWILPPRNIATRIWIDALFERAGLRSPSVKVETGSTSMLHGLLAQSELLTFTSRNYLQHEPDTVGMREINIPHTSMPRQLGLVYRKTGYISPAALALIRAGREARETARATGCASR
jgi:DNA-binding transcriptional LysR family regulator